MYFLTLNGELPLSKKISNEHYSKMTEEEKKKTKLTPQQIMEAKDAFDFFNRNSHVKVSENELVTVMRSLRQNSSQKF